ncbi:GNAT family N-acetyltransferase (plasmid) [Aminobacter sp. SR38]|nr:GNAT family N-acetyltransferase [Aminobacter sp. SR38]
MGLPFHDPAWGRAGHVHQHRRHHRQDRPDPGLHPHAGFRLQLRPVLRQLLRRRRYAGQADDRSGTRHHADHRLRLSRYRGCECLFALRQGTLGRRQGNDPRLRRCHRPDGGCHLVTLRGYAAVGDRSCFAAVGISDAIGTITLTFGATHAKTAALGFVLARAHWGQGLGSEAGREVLRYAFEILALQQVTAEAVARNFTSLRILAKLGFKHIESYIDESDGERCERFALDRDIGKALLSCNTMPDC